MYRIVIAAVTLIMAPALLLAGCNLAVGEDHIADLVGDWTGTTSGGWYLTLTIEENGAADGYYAGGGYFSGAASYIGGRFELYGDPVNLSGSFQNERLNGTLTYSDISGDIQESFTLFRS